MARTEPVLKEEVRIEQKIVDEGIPQRERIVNEEVRQVAAANIVARGKDAEYARLVATPPDALPTALDVATYQDVFNAYAKEGLAGNKEAAQKADTLKRAFEHGGRITAQAFQMRKQVVAAMKNARPGDALLDAIYEPDHVMAAQIERAENNGRTAEAERIRQRWRDTGIPALKAKLKGRWFGQDINLDDPATYSDPKRASEAFKQVSLAKGNFWDAEVQVRYGAMLSAIRGIMADAPGGAAYSMFRQTVILPLADVIGLDPKGAAARYKNLANMETLRLAWSKAITNGMTTMETERPSLQESVGHEATSFYDKPQRGGIGGIAGRGVNAGITVRIAMDEMQKTFTAYVEVVNQARAIARKKGLAGKEADAYAENLMHDFKSPAWSEAIWEGKQTSFQQDPDAVLKIVMAAQHVQVPYDVPVIGGAKPLTFPLPFSKTLWNIGKVGGRISPLGLLHALFAKATGDPHANQYLAEQVVGATLTATMYGVYDYLRDKVDWDEIGESMTPAGKNMAYRTGRQPMSAGIPLTSGKRWSYSRWEPVATTIPLTMALLYGARAVAKGDTEGALTALKFMGKTMTRKTFAQSLSNIVDWVEEPDGSATARLISQTLGQYVPAAAKQGMRAGQETMPERKVWGTGKEFMENALKRFVQGSLELPGTTAVDEWGRDKKREEGPTKGANAGEKMVNRAWKNVSPADIRTENMTLGDKVIFNYNRTAQKLYFIAESDQQYKWKGETVFMDDSQLRQFRQLSGQAADKAVHLLKPSVDAPTEADIDAIKHIISETRKRAEGQLANEWHGGIKAA
ncbi:MAG: hypothetical protein V1929_03405, partial [bacterium]